MSDRIRFIVCKNFEKELDEVFRRRGWHDADKLVLPMVCHHPSVANRIAQNLPELKSSNTDDFLLMGECLPQRDLNLGEYAGQCTYCLRSCFALLTNQTMIDFLISRGDYLLSPGWLENWEENLAAWGFDEKTASVFFHEFAQKLTLLDSGLDLASRERLEAMGAYLDLPVFHLPVGLDFLDLYLTQIVREWKQKRADLIAEEIRKELNRSAAESAMALDLLARLARTRSETDVILEIIDLFKMLFSPQDIAYGSVAHGWVDQTFGCENDPDVCTEIVEWTILDKAEYGWTSSGSGFLLRFNSQDETVGVVRLDRFLIPEYRQKYLNVALTLADICGSVVSNARIYQKLQETEENLRRGLENSEILRQIMNEISSTLGLGDLLPRILTSFFRIIPYRVVSIFLVQNGVMTFQAGRQATRDGVIGPYAPQDKYTQFEATAMPPAPLVFPASIRPPDDPHYESEEHIRGWMGVPLMAGEKRVGYMFIGNHPGQVFNAFDLRLAYSFADQAVIAIENDRLFRETQKAAITDSLTGLNNRRFFMSKAEDEIIRARRYRRPLSLVMIDIDFFKKVNDTFGHSEGDRVLAHVAGICLHRIRSVDTAARYGGEEFVLLLPETDIESARLLAERLRIEIAESPLQCPNGEINITVSMGVAGMKDDTPDVDEVLRRADSMLYQAKHSGRNRVCVDSSPKDAAGEPRRSPDALQK